MVGALVAHDAVGPCHPGQRATVATTAAGTVRVSPSVKPLAEAASARAGRTVTSGAVCDPFGGGLGYLVDDVTVGQEQHLSAYPAALGRG